MSYDQTNYPINYDFEYFLDKLVIKFNESFGTSYTTEEFKVSNSYALILFALQGITEINTVQNANFDKIISFLKDNLEASIKYKGSSIIGLTNLFEEDSIIDNFNIAIYDNYPSELNLGEVAFVFDYTETAENNEHLVNLLGYNLCLGGVIGHYSGNTLDAEFLSGFYSTSNGKTSYQMAWRKPRKINTKIEIQYSYDAYDNVSKVLSESEIQEIYMNNFNDISEIGKPLYPDKINNLNLFKGISKIDTKFSIDDGVTYTNLDEQFYENYFTIYNISSIDDITIIET